MKIRDPLQVVISLALIGALFLTGVLIDWDISLIERYVSRDPVEGALIYVLFLAVSIVLLPLSSLPLLPLAAYIWGIWLGGLLSAVGWWLGSLAAFMIARFLGRPFMEWFVSLEKIDEWERDLPQRVTFSSIVVIRMVFPVEIPSFAMGLIKTLSFKTYALASLIGILPFAFVLVGLGEALINRQWIMLGGLIITLLVAILIIYRIYINRER